MQLFSDNKIVLTLIGACVILLVTTFIVSLYLNKMKNSKPDGVLADDSWDCLLYTSDAADECVNV